MKVTQATNLNPDKEIQHGTQNAAFENPTRLFYYLYEKKVALRKQN